MAFVVPQVVVLDRAAAVIEAGLAALKAGEIEFDFSRVEQGDSSLLACLLAWRRSAGAAGSSFRVVGPSERLRALATLYGVDGFTLN